jgi:hypothetical protein
LDAANGFGPAGPAAFEYEVGAQWRSPLEYLVADTLVQFAAARRFCEWSSIEVGVFRRFESVIG